jgi:hypothetical protein
MHGPKMRLTSQGEHAHIRLSLKSSLADVGYYIYNDQIKLKGEHEAIKRENQGGEQGERRPLMLVRTQNTIATHLATHLNTNKLRSILQTNQTIQPLSKSS